MGQVDTLMSLSCFLLSSLQVQLHLHKYFNEPKRIKEQTGKNIANRRHLNTPTQ